MHWPGRAPRRSAATCCARSRACRRWCSAHPCPSAGEATSPSCCAASASCCASNAAIRIGGSSTAVDSPFGPALFNTIPRRDIDLDAAAACAAARRTAAPVFSRSYFVPQSDGAGLEVIDLCLPVSSGGRDEGVQIATLSLQALLQSALPAEPARGHELSFVEVDGARLARAGVPRGTGVYMAERLVDLPGTTLRLRIDSAAGPPSLIPNLATALVLGLSVTLFALVLLLARDVGRRARAEAALAEALAFRKAMEDSLITGLRARDLHGHISYVNPAFCAMVGFSADELRQAGTPPYWPPELADQYQQRQLARLAANGPGEAATREGFETLFMRKNGERFAVMIYEAPLVDGQGQHTGWMSAVLDVSAQRRVEDLSRQQQERLQATARLATIGEMASLLSHELNQPLAAIASYASGSLNLMDAARCRDAGAAAPGDAAHGRAGRARRPRHQERARLRAPARAASRIDRRGPAARRRAATGATAGAQERHPGRHRPAAAGAARASATAPWSSRCC